MKKLLLFVASVFSLAVVFGTSGLAATPTNSWKVELYTPALSDTKRSLNIEYKVLSINEADNTYSVKLFQNDVEVSNQALNHPYGDSGVFSVSLPANGTYTYKVSVDNVNAGQTKVSSSKSVTIVNGPQPIVTTTAVSNSGQAATGTTAAADGSQAAVAGANTGATGTNAAPGSTEDASNDGKVTDEAANTDKKDGQALGAATNKNNASGNTKWFILGAVILGLGAGAYYWLMRRGREA